MKGKKKIQFNLRIPTIQVMKAYCKQHGYSHSELVGNAIEFYIKENIVNRFIQSMPKNINNIIDKLEDKIVD